MQIEIVVAKYNEDLAWLSYISDWKTMVYDKSKDIPNVGREAETWIRHIVENYDNLSDYTVFLQGDPRDHLRFPINDLKENITKLCNSDIEPLNTIRTEIPYEFSLHVPEYYQHIFGKCLGNTVIKFSPGAQYVVPKTKIIHRPKHFYGNLQSMLSKYTGSCWMRTFEPHVMDAWLVERLWMFIFSTDH